MRANSARNLDVGDADLATRPGPASPNTPTPGRARQRPPRLRRSALRGAAAARTGITAPAVRGAAGWLLPDGWWAPVAAVVVGGVGARWPVPALAVAVVGVLVWMAFAAPRTLVGVTVLAVLLVRPLQHLIPAPQVSYLDDGMVALCGVTLPARRLLERRSLRTFPGQWWFVGFVVCGLLSGLLLYVPASIFLVSAYVSCKGLLLAWAVAQLDWTERHLRAAAGVGAAVIIGCLVATAVNLAIPATWTALMASDTKAVEARSFLPSLIGPFTHPLDLGQFMALSAIALASWRTVVRRGVLTVGLLLATSAAALLTGRRTAITSLVTAWLWTKAKARSGVVLVAVLAVLPAALVVLAGPLTTVVAATYADYIAKSTSEARTVLTVDSFRVAAAHFPGGAGFGRFGSAVAASTYSPEYVARGYPYIWGLGRTVEDGRFLTDTEWPAIIGETGFFGAAAFVAGMVSIYRSARRLWSSTSSPHIRWFALMGIGWLIACLVQSIATVSFTGPPIFGLFFGMVGILGSLSHPAGSDMSISTGADQHAAPQVAARLAGSPQVAGDAGRRGLAERAPAGPGLSDRRDGRVPR